jgi:DNA-binding transcriptional LysR family regulator
MNITLRQLEAAIAVAERGNFSRAAEALGTTQPALSLQIRELEELIGLRLFDRTTRRVEPTRAGQEFIHAIGKILGDLDLAVARVSEIAHRQRGRISIAAPPLLASVVLPQTIAKFRVIHPGIDIALADLPSDKIVERVIAGAADLGLGTFATRDPALSSTALIADSLALFAAPGDALAGVTPIAWHDLADVALVTLTRESGIRFLVDHGCESAGFQARIAHEVSQIATALALVEAGLGVAVLPTYAFAVARGMKLVARPLVDPVVRREISLVRSLERSIPPGAEEFIRILSRQVQAMVPPGLSPQDPSA